MFVRRKAKTPDGGSEEELGTQDFSNKQHSPNRSQQK